MRVFEFSRRAPTMSPAAVIWVWMISRAMVILFGKLFYRLRMYGAESIPRTGPMVYVANHQSHFDPLFVGCLIADRPFTSLARESLFRFKPFELLLRLYCSVPLKREGGDKAALDTAIGVLRRGGCILLFPEGTRTRDGAIAEFKAGFLLLVRRTKAPVVPIAIEGAHDVWRHGTKFPRLHGRIIMRAGTPISSEQLLSRSADSAVSMVRKRIDEMRLELRAQLRRESGGRYPAPGPADEPLSGD